MYVCGKVKIIERNLVECDDWSVSIFLWIESKQLFFLAFLEHLGRKWIAQGGKWVYDITIGL